MSFRIKREAKPREPLYIEVQATLTENSTESPRIMYNRIDWHNESDRIWAADHLTWCLHNGVGITLTPLP